MASSLISSRLHCVPRQAAAGTVRGCPGVGQVTHFHGEGYWGLGWRAGAPRHAFEQPRDPGGFTRTFTSRVPALPGGGGDKARPSISGSLAPQSPPRGKGVVPREG